MALEGFILFFKFLTYSKEDPNAGKDYNEII